MTQAGWQHRTKALRLSAIGLIAVGTLWAVPVSAVQNADAALAESNCDVHIWQRGIYATESHSSAVGGIVGSVIRSEYDRKYPADTVEGLLEDVLNINALPDTLKGIKWADFTKAGTNSIVYEKGTFSDADFKKVKSSKERMTASKSDCYLEIYVGKQTFSGGSIKSHLFSDLYARTFYGKRFKANGAILWDQTSKVRLEDDEMKEAARQTFKTSFAIIFSKFLSKKLAKR
jgi:hypothetical protein